MLIQLLKRQVAKKRSLIHKEAGQMQDFLRLLMKQRNTGTKWTVEEIRYLKTQIVRLSPSIPVLIVVMLPFGIIFFPLFAEVLDRRSKSRLSRDVSPPLMRLEGRNHAFKNSTI